MKKFIVTVDTEGDALWDKSAFDNVETKNAQFIPRFQELCEKHGIKPVYLVNYEMAMDDYFVSYIKPKAEAGLCEIGMHLHAWNMPGEYTLEERTDGRHAKPFLIELTDDEMEEKISIMTDTIKERFGVAPVSHRAGRWAMDDRYYALLKKYGYKADCSVTPYVNWKNQCGFSENSRGADYSSYPEQAYIVKTENGNLWEVPVTIKNGNKFTPTTKKFSLQTLRHFVRCRTLGETTWFRIMNNDIKPQLSIINKNKNDYLMMMLHSSELLPGNRYFKTEKDVNDFLHNIEKLFIASKDEYEGITLSDYVELLSEE